MPTVIADNLTDRVREIAQETVREPFYIVDVVVRGQKGSRVVEVYVDSDEELTLKELGDISREIGFTLETEEVVDGRYKLNVSSPGVDRPLALPRQFRKNVGREVAVTFVDPDRRSVKGRITQADEEAFYLGNESNDINLLSYGEVKEVRVLLPW